MKVMKADTLMFIIYVTFKKVMSIVDSAANQVNKGIKIINMTVNVSRYIYGDVMSY